MIEKACGCGCCGAAAATAGAAPAEEGMSVYLLGGLDCADCAAKLEKRIAALAGVRQATVNFATAKMAVAHTLSDAAIIKTVERAGYRARRADAPTDHASGWRRDPRTLATLASGLLLAAAVGLDILGAAAGWTAAAYALAALAGGWHAARTGLSGLRSLTFDMNFLMTVAVIGAAAIGEWSEGAMVAFLFSLGNTLQTYTLDKTRRAVRALMELAPSEATVLDGDAEERRAVAAISPGSVIVVRPGERIALDGVVSDGHSAVDEAALTGESLPVEKKAGDAVYAGTLNQYGVLAIEVTKAAADSTLAKIMHLVEEAQSQRAPSQQFVDKFARYYTPAVLTAAAAVMVLPWLAFGQPFAPWFYKGLVLLVISCPCALVISTPVSVVAAIGNASRRGVLIKGGAYLEKLGTLRAVTFDKTGTLTHGRPRVTDAIPLGGLTCEQLLALAAAVEKWSEHPVAQAIVTAAAGLELKPAAAFRALVGQGAQAEVEGTVVYVGNARLFTGLGHDLARHEAVLAGLEEAGKTAMLVGTAEIIYGVVAVADTLRDDSADAIAALRRAGVAHVAMLTGDNRRSAEAVAACLKLDGVHSELMPADKVRVVKDLADRYGGVAMVGDGVNDAPALAAADIGVAMGVVGSDAALETADIALMADDLGKLAYVIRLSRKTVAVIKENIIFAIAVKAVFVVLTFAGLTNLWLAVFADTGASLLVTLNGMRLMRKLA